MKRTHRFASASNRFRFESLEDRTLLAGDVAGAFGDLASIAIETADPESGITSYAEGEGTIFVVKQSDGDATIQKANPGEAASTPVASIAGTIESSFVFNGKLFFSTKIGEGTDGTDPIQLWVSDGTEPGTASLKTLGTWGNFSPSFDVAYQPMSSRLVVHAGSSFWSTDGTELGTVQIVKGSSDQTVVGDVGETNGVWVFGKTTIVGDQLHNELWTTDPPGQSVQVLRGFEAEVFEFILTPGITRLATVGETVFFAADEGTTDYELWKTDGSLEGTALVADINPVAETNDARRGGSQPRDLINVGGTLFLTADDGQHGRELWVSDGTADGTKLVSDLNPGDGSTSFGEFAAVGDRLFFTAITTKGIHTLYTSDGTEAGTELVMELAGPILSTRDRFPAPVAAKDRLFFVMDDGTHGVELWVSDGTEQGTNLAADINPSGNANPQQLKVADDRLLFLADDGGGIDLWSITLAQVDSTSNGLPGDFDQNGIVEFADFLTLARNFGQAGGPEAGDANADGEIGFADFLIMAQNFGKRLTG